MKGRIATFWALAAAGVLTASIGLVPAAGSQSAAATTAASERTPMLGVSVQSRLRSGGYSGGVSASHSLQLDKPTRVHFQTVAGYPCVVSGGGLPPETPGAPEGPVEWTIEAQLVGLENDQATVDVRWSRLVDDVASIGAESIHAEQRFVLSQDQTEVLDLLRVPEHVAGDCDVVPIVLTFSFAEPPDLENVALSYDIWLVQTDKDGRRMTERFRTTARQGQAARFFFPPLLYTRDGLRVDTGGAAKVSIDGEIRGRATREGRIDLSVGASRMVMEIDRRLGQGDGGGKRLAGLRPGETVEFPLPGAPFMNEIQEVLAGQRTALRVTVDRVW